MRGFHVLLVDDNFVFNMETCEFLQTRGFDVQATYTAHAAMAAIDQAERLSGLVTDIDLGPGPDGFAVARYARSRYPHLPVVYVSANPDIAPSQGVEGAVLILKPLDPGLIVVALDRAIRLEAAA